MTIMIFASLPLNIAVLVPVCAGLISDAVWAQDAYGGATPARGILTAVYTAILVMSVALLFWRDPKIVASLLLVQIIYKVLTVYTVGLLNPVIVSNLAITAFHILTLVIIARALS